MDEQTMNGTKQDNDTKGKVLVIGLDGATFDLIKPWAEQGHLPTLARLLEEGAHGSLHSTLPPMTAPAWTSFATGVNPGKHRLYDWIAREPDSYRFQPVTSLDCKAPTIYSLLGDAGREVCVLNVPMTYPPLSVNGVMISGMPAPTANSSITYPETLYDEIIENVGDYILYPDPGQAYSDSGIDDFLERLYRATELRVQTLDYLQSRTDYDFAMLVFNGTDAVSHAMWKFMDESHPLHDPAKADKYGNAIRDYYMFVDEKLAGIVDSLEDDTTLILMSDHGFGPFHKFIHVNNWLMDQGFMKVKHGPVAGAKRTAFRAGFSPMNVYDKMMKFGLGGMKKEVVRGQGQNLMKMLFLSFEDIDWSRTQAYSLGNVGQVCINVADREPQGCVQPGEEYEQLRDEIIARLYELRDPETGEQVVEKVYRREEIYGGDYLELAPDIIFIPLRLEYFGFGEYEFGSHKIIEPMRRGISGTHRLNGIFMAYGSKIQPGVEVEGASLVDLAPTILRLMNEPDVEEMDGRVLHEIACPEVDLSQVIEPSTNKASANGNQNGSDNGGTGTEREDVLSEEDQKLLAKRLRSLGYVG
jgi:predicted AlkP superfamily phosphohydrolase/phosphomutase